MAKRKKTPRFQPRIQGVRRMPGNSSELPELNAHIAATAIRYGVSKSWVRAQALADAFGVDIVRYDGEKRRDD